MSGALPTAAGDVIWPQFLLDEAQQAAIRTPGNVVVRAGAGSGKTEVLARRFVALLAGDLQGGTPLLPAALAAITFTEKAALDLRQRIGVVLAERLAREQAIGAAELLRHLQRAQRTLALARISTIHAFCARILRENAFAAGLDPDFAVLDEDESGTLIERICRQTLVEAVRAGDPGAHFLVQARGLRGTVNREGALEILQRLLTEMRRYGYQAEWITTQTAAAANPAVGQERVAAAAGELVALIDQLLVSPDARPDAIEELAKVWPAARPAILAIDAAATADAIAILRDVVDAMPTAHGKLGALVKASRELVEKGSNRFGLRGALIAAWGERQAAPVAANVAKLLARTSDALERAKADDHVLTFDDLLVNTRDLLRDAPGIAGRYRTELRAILVDEYQDTDRLQDEIIARLTEPGPDQSSRPELFIVGDEKQSIYRFRGADVRVFNRPRAPTPRYLPLAGNRRSTSAIVDFVNEVSAVAMGAGEDSSPSYRVVWGPEHALTPYRSGAPDHAVEIIAALADSEPAASGLQAPAKRGLEARALANRIAGLVAEDTPITDPRTGLPRQIEYRDIAVLFRAFGQVTLYEDALSAAGIPCYTVQGRGFYARREVIDLVALLAAVDDPRDSIQLATALRSPLFGLSDQCLLEIGLRIHAGQGASLAAVFAGPEPDLPWLSVDREQAEWAWSVIRELRSLRAHLGVPAMVERALELTDYESVMAGLEQGAQRNANLRKVVDLAYRFDSRRFFTLHDFVAYLRRLVETEPYEPQAQILAETDNVVRLMTVHQAKGLEFPVVIVADAGRGPNRDNRAPLLAPDGRLLLHATDGSGADEIPNAAIEEYRHGLSDQEEAESARILYVALTRARDRLIVSEGSGTSGWSKYLRQLVGDAAWQRFAAGDDRALQVDCGATRAVLRKPDCSAPVMAPSGVPGADSDLRWPPAGTESANGSNQGAPVSGGVLGANGRAAAAAAVTSPTALADFDRCPRQYWFRHEIGLPERGAQAVSDTGRGAALGLVAHAVLERVAANGADQTREIDELTERLGRAAGLEGAERAAITRDLARYVTFRPLGEMILGREVPFMLHVGETLFVRGQIDVIARAKDQLIVRDYKYAKSADVPRYQVQMECYALAMTTASRGVKVAAEIVALRDNPAVVEVALPQAEMIRARLGKLGDELAAARRANDFPKKPAKAAACRALGCGYIARCWGNRDAGEQLSLNLPDRY